MSKNHKPSNKKVVVPDLMTIKEMIREGFKLLREDCEHTFAVLERIETALHNMETKLIVTGNASEEEFKDWMVVCRCHDDTDEMDDVYWKVDPKTKRGDWRLCTPKEAYSLKVGFRFTEEEAIRLIHELDRPSTIYEHPRAITIGEFK